MGLTTRTGNSGPMNTTVGVLPPTQSIFNYNLGPGVLRQIYCQLPSNVKILSIRITLDGNIIFEDTLENLNRLSKRVTEHANYKVGHELDLHFTNSIDVTIYGNFATTSTSTQFPYRVACTCICNV